MAATDNNPATQTANPVQEKVARTVSIIVLVGTCVLGVLGMAIAIVALTTKKEDIAGAKDILQILFSAILPLFGTWIGTILAYYFSKENLLAANQTVRELVKSITSDTKLESTKAKDVMIPIDKLTYKPYPSGTDDKTINLKTDFLDFINAKGISRVILLDENKCAKYVLHRSTIEGFIAEQYFKQDETAGPNNPPANNQQNNPPAPVDNPPAGQNGNNQDNPPQAPRTLTFADLKAKGNETVQAILKDGVKFIKEDANLSDAKVLIKNYAACNDVFITKNGSAADPVLGWITDKTIAESSIVN
ncbi:hypothetical protein [Flavisolibacter ginsenosidimutans]|uniref:Uncharacterized protein n=1 Tax=Flavisolibacter ginsenosidimutans TaxID=661481 RepID=A0A5B8UKV0_9BACT|nr:hypothetical protein [Flavisolibacter ginsenosidimutans]QEC56645.1 hypothetical protein FSB75_12315 [Flavisolibacter ginsenosidimutans]